MKILSAISLLSITAALTAKGGGLYYIPNETEETFPIKWSVGMTATWDDNTTPTAAGADDATFSVNPYVAAEFASATPQTTWDVYAKLGMLYYLDKPTAAGSDDMYGQVRAGVNLTHRFDERLQLVSRSFVSYELEPDYSFGFAVNRQSSEYIFFDTDNSLGYRWTERLATYTGIKLTMLNYDSIPNADRFTWTVYNQFRYVLSPQTVGTASVRYAQTTADGVARDSSDIYLLVGAEHRFTPSTILIGSVGAQLRYVDGAGGDSSANPFLELTLRTQVNEQFMVSSFLRYGAEAYGTVVSLPALAEFDSRLTLRIGSQANYQISEKLSLFSGLDLIVTSYEEGRTVPGGLAAPDQDEILVNAYIGASLKLTEYLDGTISYNFTSSNSDIPNNSYERNRISVGLKAEF